MTALGAGVAVGDAADAPAPVMVRKRLGMPRLAPRPFPPSLALPAHFTPPTLQRVPLPGGRLGALPGDGNLLALTVDDGVDSAVVAAYANWIADSGMRVTFFLNGSRSSWTDNADALRPLVANGQVQLANHTWAHPDLTACSDARIEDELLHNNAFIRDTYGVEARPYYRPPFGFIDARVTAVAASVGYTQPVLWYGSLADSGLLTDAQLMQFATDWLLPDHIVIGHANWPTVTRHFSEIADLIRARGLQPVTLDDVFLRP